MCESVTSGPKDRTSGLPGSDKNLCCNSPCVAIFAHFLQLVIEVKMPKYKYLSWIEGNATCCGAIPLSCVVRSQLRREAWARSTLLGVALSPMDLLNPPSGSEMQCLSPSTFRFIKDNLPSDCVDFAIR